MTSSHTNKQNKQQKNSKNVINEFTRADVNKVLGPKPNMPKKY